MFYFGAALLGLLAAIFACWPAVRSRREHSRKPLVEHNQVVRDVYRSRVAELARETEDQALRAEIEDELGAVLLTEVEPDASAAPTVAFGFKRTVVWLLAALVPLGGVAVYLLVAEPTLQQIRGAEEVLSLAADDPALESWALKLSERTARAPDDSKSWYLLGHAYLKLKRFGEAAESFAMTSSIAPEDLNVQVYWLQARYLAAGGTLDAVSRGIADSILEKEPNIPVVIEILALDAFHRGAGAEAITLLNKAMTGARDMRAQASFAAAIRQVRQTMQDDAPPGVQVNVAAAQDAPPHGTVFVIARPIGGGMPFAVTRRPAFLLPFSVTLDDLVSMSPTRLLSQAEDFEVVVRLSASGNAMPADGDWQWVSQPLPPVGEETTILDALLTPS
jgi:cytochrome c-type biogenesis protein CcmH